MPASESLFLVFDYFYSYLGHQHAFQRLSVQILEVSLLQYWCQPHQS